VPHTSGRQGQAAANGLQRKGLQLGGVAQVPGRQVGPYGASWAYALQRR